MRTYATAQQIGTRSHQCDATATRRTADGGRAYVLLDGISSGSDVAHWTRAITQRLAVLTARTLQPHKAIESVQAEITAEPGWADEVPGACAVIAVTAPDQLLRVAWIGDCRAYLLHPDGHLARLTTDHNRRALLEAAGLPVPYYARNHVTRCMGHPVPEDDDPCPGLPRNGEELAPEWTAVHDRTGTRLLLASDGLYEPIEDKGLNLAGAGRRAPGRDGDRRGWRVPRQRDVPRRRLRLHPCYLIGDHCHVQHPAAAVPARLRPRAGLVPRVRRQRHATPGRPGDGASGLGDAAPAALPGLRARPVPPQPPPHLTSPPAPGPHRPRPPIEGAAP